MSEPLNQPRGFCVSCDATAKYNRGRGGDPAFMIWTLDGEEIGREEWPWGSNASICPPCWKRIKDDQAARDAAWAEKEKLRAAGGAAMKIVVMSRKPRKKRRKQPARKAGSKSYRNGVSKQER